MGSTSGDAAEAASQRPRGDFSAAVYGQITLGVVAIAFGVPPDEILSPSRRAHIAFARQTAMYLLHTVFRMNQSRVGRTLGRDRTTASYACRVVEDARENPAIDGLIGACEASLGSLPGLVWQGDPPTKTRQTVAANAELSDDAL